MPYKKRILTVGASNMDTSVTVLRFPDKGETLRDEGGISYAPGRGGANAAIALAKLGAISVFATRIGLDLYGQKLYNYYKESGIDTSFVKVDRDFSTGLSLSVREADGSVRRVNFPGANEHLTTDAISEAISTSPDAVFINFESGFSLASKVAKIAAARRVPIFVDASPANANLALESLPELEVFALSDADVKRYTGISTATSQDAMRAAFAMRRKVSAKYIVINQGARGAMIYDGKRCEIISPQYFEKPVDPRAADEAFSASLCSEYFASGNIKDATKFALVASGVTASRFGAATSLPTREELVEIISRGE
jgi:ribokinase